MLVVSCVCLIAVFLVQLDASKKISFGYGLAFFLVTFIQAIHYDYGNDYMVYLREFNYFTYNSFSFAYLLDYLNYRDPFWPLFCYLFKPLGFFGLVAFLAIFQSAVYFYFIRKYVPEKWLALGVFVYLFTPSLYLLNMSMMRQGFVESIFLFSFLLVQKKSVVRYVVAILIMLFAGQMHSSANLFIPFLLWPLIPMKNAKYIAFALLVSFVVFRVAGNLVENIMSVFLRMPTFERFGHYVGTMGGGVGVGYMIMSIPAVVILLFLNDSQDESKNRIVSMAVFERIMLSFSSVVMLAGRLAIFFSIFYMVAIPVTYSKIQDANKKILLTSIYVAITLYCYIGFYQDPTYSRFYKDYHSILEILFL